MRLAAGNTWVAARGPLVEGFITLEPEGHIDMLYVDADLQGRGIASALLGRLTASARSQGLTQLSTEASITDRRDAIADRTSSSAVPRTPTS